MFPAAFSILIFPSHTHTHTHINHGRRKPSRSLPLPLPPSPLPLPPHSAPLRLRHHHHRLSVSLSFFNSEPLLGGRDDHIPADPLLETCAFIDPHADQAEPVPEEESTPAAADAEATPISRRNRRTLEDAKAEDRPNWLPEDWIMDLKVQNSGATARTVDRKNQAFYAFQDGIAQEDALKSRKCARFIR